MNRYRNVPGLRGSKATASTLCQKCLKRGHYSYECTVSAQDRPYISRPSRTQQLQNPELIPTLSSDNPNHLLQSYVSRFYYLCIALGLTCVFRESAADKLLSQREELRGRKTSNVEDDSRRMERSISSHSMSSVSTISTNRSPSVSPDRHRKSRHSKSSRKRRYSSSSAGSVASYSSTERPSRPQNEDRNIRRRHRRSSPEERGRRSSWSGDSVRREGSHGRDGDRSRVARQYLSNEGRGDYGESLQRRGRSPLGNRPGRAEPAATRKEKERSLSPYSRRLALTQAMNIGR